MTADEKVNAWVLADFRANHTIHNATQEHLVHCPDARVSDHDITDGDYGCDTGCEFATLNATITCSHDVTDEYQYGTFGTIADILDDIGLS